MVRDFLLKISLANPRLGCGFVLLVRSRNFFRSFSCFSVAFLQMSANLKLQLIDLIMFFFSEKKNQKSRPGTRRNFQNELGFCSTLINGFRNESVLRLEYLLLVRDRYSLFVCIK